MTIGAKPSPLLGFNSNVRYRGCVFHIQTEDSGRERPRVTTLLFVDGGQIVASRRSDYGDLLADPALAVKLKQQMQDQHRSLLVELKSGQLDDKIEAVVGRLAPRAAVTEPSSSRRGADVEMHGAHSLVDPLRVMALKKDGASNTGADDEARRRAPKPPLRLRPSPSPEQGGVPKAQPGHSGLLGSALDDASLNDVILSFISQEIE